MSYPEKQWTPTTVLMSQIVQAFNLQGNEDLVRAYSQPETWSIVAVLLEAVNRRTAEMGYKWACEARKLIRSDSLFPALRETMSVLEEILSEDARGSEVESKAELTQNNKTLNKNLEELGDKDSFGLENVPVIKL